MVFPLISWVCLFKKPSMSLSRKTHMLSPDPPGAVPWARGQVYLPEGALFLQSPLGVSLILRVRLRACTHSLAAWSSSTSCLPHAVLTAVITRAGLECLAFKERRSNQEFPKLLRFFSKIKVKVIFSNEKSIIFKSASIQIKGANSFAKKCCFRRTSVPVPKIKPLDFNLDFPSYICLSAPFAQTCVSENLYVSVTPKKREVGFWQK